MKRRESQVDQLIISSFFIFNAFVFFSQYYPHFCPQALLEGIRKSRLSNTNMLAVDKEEVES